MTFDDLTETQVDRICRKRVEKLCHTLRARSAKAKRIINDMRDFKSACVRIGAWDKSIAAREQNKS